MHKSLYLFVCCDFNVPSNRMSLFYEFRLCFQMFTLYSVPTLVPQCLFPAQRI